jgi:hypothetical protein
MGVNENVSSTGCDFIEFNFCTTFSTIESKR